MRPAEDRSASRSATPIYDTLYAEYRRSFRALPGDRSGEEDLVFTGFGVGAYGAARQHHMPHYQPTQHHQWQPPRQPAPAAHVPVTQHFPAALPPAPRRAF
ncbi:hypothetical protein [Streptomyces beihaiensis]|uniref:Uncharacterized protein n=1 Tax=Streptomyces beihaiensis TaxID=2984495 RepID=A0ABT3TRL5_9ACTN|nr:hypothetical protein [Streptomyces beihaiensis]MCX3059688.1 hypothetical protein [Streptomyces beihaiensis]